MLDFEADIEFVKSQLAFHEAQAVKYANEPRRAERHHSTAIRFRALLSDLTEAAQLLETLPELRERAGNAPRLTLAWDEIEGLPPEVLAELSISDSDKTEFSVQSAIRELGGVASLDRLIVYLFKTTGEVHKRTPLNQRLYRMSQKDMIFSVPGKKGVYSISPLTEEDAAKLN